MQKSQKRPKKAKSGPVGYQLSEETRARLNAMAGKIELSRAGLAHAVGCSLSTLKSILNGSTMADAGFRRSILEKLCAVLGTSLDEVEGRVNLTGQYDFSELGSILAGIDASIMPVLRDSLATSATISAAYNDLLELRSARHQLILKDVCSRFNSVGFWANCFYPFPEPNLTIRASDDLSTLSYSFGSNVLSVSNPRLLRDCLCADTNRPDQKCPVHSHAAGNEVLTRFDSGINRLNFMGTTVFFRLEKSLWPPSMDSLLMVKSLKEHGVFEKRYSRVLDLGSGTGFLGLIMMRQNPSVQSVHLADWMLSPTFWGSFNWMQNRKNREHVEVKTILGRFGDRLSEGQMPYDICVCNPPYLPEHKGNVELNERSAVYGTELLRYVISNHRRLARTVYMQFSQIAYEDAKKECARANVRLIPMGAPACLPFRASYRKLKDDYLAFLESRGMIVDSSKPYPYWHRIQLYRVEAQ